MRSVLKRLVVLWKGLSPPTAHYLLPGLCLAHILASMRRWPAWLCSGNGHGRTVDVLSGWPKKTFLSTICHILSSSGRWIHITQNPEWRSLEMKETWASKWGCQVLSPGATVDFLCHQSHPQKYWGAQCKIKMWILLFNHQDKTFFYDPAFLWAYEHS